MLVDIFLFVSLVKRGISFSVFRRFLGMCFFCLGVLFIFIYLERFFEVGWEDFGCFFFWVLVRDWGLVRSYC